MSSQHIRYSVNFYIDCLTRQVALFHLDQNKFESPSVRVYVAARSARPAQTPFDRHLQTGPTRAARCPPPDLFVRPRVRYPRDRRSAPFAESAPASADCRPRPSRAPPAELAPAQALADCAPAVIPKAVTAARRRDPASAPRPAPRPTPCGSPLPGLRALGAVEGRNDRLRAGERITKCKPVNSSRSRSTCEMKTDSSSSGIQMIHSTMKRR
jgi:hypothetical protein